MNYELPTGGIRALPADATPAQRAEAESWWASVGIDDPCPCSGSCHHGKPLCEDDDCAGRLRHVDRFASGLFTPPPHIWHDVYQCDGCGEEDAGHPDRRDHNALSRTRRPPPPSTT